VQPSSIGTPQRGSRQVLYLAEPRDKITMSLVSLFSVIRFFSRVLAKSLVLLFQSSILILKEQSSEEFSL
jgi:hypothetical protein